MKLTDVKREIEECKKQGMPNFMIEEHILDLIAEQEDETEESEGLK